MALFGFRDYRDDDVGGTEFQKEDGTSVYLAGPAAEDLKRRLDESRYAGATAENIPLAETGVTPTHSDYGRVSDALKGVGIQPVRTDVMRQMPTPQDRPITGEMAAPQPAPEQLRAPQSAAAAPVVPPRQPGMLDQLTPEQRAAVLAPVYSPGRAAVDPERMRREGVAVPMATTTQRTTGAPYDEVAAAERARAEERVQQAALGKMEAEEAAQYERAAISRQNAERLSDESEQRQLARNQAKQRVDEMWQRAQAADEAVRAGRINPDRFFQERGTWATIGAAIAMGLGAYGASARGGRNYAQDIIQGAIDRDIEAQKADIAKNRDLSKSALQQWRESVGDLDTAEALLRTSMERAASAEMDAFAAKSAGAVAPEAYQQWQAERAQQALLAEQERKAQAFGREVTSVQERFVQPQAAVYGGARAPGLETIAKRMGQLGAISEVTGKLGGTGEGRLPPEKEKDVQAYAEEVRQERIAEMQLARLAKLYGGRLTPNGKFEDTGEQWDIPGIGVTSAAPALVTTSKGVEVRNAQNEAAFALASALNDKVTDADLEFAKDVIKGGPTDTDARKALESAAAQLGEKRRTRDAKYSAETRRLYRGRAAEAAGEINRASQPR